MGLNRLQSIAWTKDDPVHWLKYVSPGLSYLRRIYTTSEISVRASKSNLGRIQNKWIDVLYLHWSKSVSEIFVSDVCVRARLYMLRFPRMRTPKSVRGCAMRMLKAACAHGRYCGLPKWPWPRITSDPRLGCSVNKTQSGARTLTRTRMLGQC